MEKKEIFGGYIIYNNCSKGSKVKYQPFKSRPCVNSQHNWAQ